MEENFDEDEEIKKLKRPIEPAPDACCGNGCRRCVWDVYYEKLDKYEKMVEEIKERRKKEKEALQDQYAVETK